jgi:hypothetical protein
LRGDRHDYCRQIRGRRVQTLEEVKLTEGAEVEVHVPEGFAPNRPKSVRDWPIFGMWAGREDVPDDLTYEDRTRRHATEPR